MDITPAHPHSQPSAHYDRIMAELTLEDVLPPASPGRLSARPAPGASTVSVEDLAVERERDIAAHVLQLFREARHYRRPLVERWLRSYNVLHNRTWGTRQSWMPSPEVPEVWPIVSAIVGWQTDGRPTFFVSPMMQPHTDAYGHHSRLAEDLVTALRAAWQANDYDAEIETFLWDANAYGTGIVKALWDPIKVAGMGDAVMRRVDPFTFYPDPRAQSWESANHFLEVNTLSIEECDRRWPGAARKIRGGDVGRMDHDKTPDRINPQGRPSNLPSYGPIPGTAGASSAFVPASGNVQQPFESDPGVTVFECWRREHFYVEDPNVVADDGKPVKRTVERWRCTIVAGSVVLMDEPATELWSHGQHPYERYVLQETGELWGQSLVELLTPMQLSINRLLAAIEHNIWLTGNPVFIEDTRSGLQRTHVTNKPGQRLTVNPNSRADWGKPPNFGNGFDPMNLIHFYVGRMEAISGLSSINRGYSPTGRNSEGVMDSVQESAFVRVRVAQRNLERTLHRVGDKITSLIVEFYDAPRIVTIAGPGGQETATALRGLHWWLPTHKGRLPMRYALHVEAGSSLPTSRSSRIEEAVQLFAMGIYDEEAVLEAITPPNWQRTLARVREMKSRGLMQPPGARQRAGRNQ